MPRALIVDDDTRFAPALAQLVEKEGYDVSVVNNLSDARNRLNQQATEVALIDLMLPDGDGIDLIRELTYDTKIKVIVITGYAGLDNAVEALRAGAVDFLTKPLDIEQLRTQLKNIHKDINLDHRDQSSDINSMHGLDNLIGSSEAMKEIYGLIKKAAPTDTTVFIHGESGTGKELVAQAIHRHSQRAQGPFIALNCGALPANLIGTELFGHERGAFTDAQQQHKGCFERAQGGTLFLDEITEMSLELQVQLLRVLEARTLKRLGGSQEISLNVRIIAATNRPPQQAVADGHLREDLLFRLMVFPIYVPPLQQRGNDVIQLAEYFLNMINERETTSKSLTSNAKEYILRYSWPGNVRELRNAIQHAYILAENEIHAKHFPREYFAQAPNTASPLTFTVGTPLSDYERRFVLATLEHYQGNKKEAAEALGVSLKTLYNKLNEYQKYQQNNG